jgi:ligand-binding sensor domain-containing protein/serine phosphatase RsbU (regulator of sigma subunit)
MRNQPYSRLFAVMLLAFLFACVPTLFSQTINLNQFGIEEGLPQSSIYTMLQDKDGSIWVGTMNGVSKYNGLNFENFTRTDGLAENRVTSSCIDKNGDIWFGHWSGGITLYSSKTKHFTTVATGTLKLTKTINTILCDQKGVLWFATQGQGLLSCENGQFYATTTADGLPSDEVSSLAMDPSGVLWIGTDEGIVTRNTKLTSFNRVMPSQHIRSLFCDSKGNIWIGTADQGVVKLSPGGGAMKIYNTAWGLSSNYVRTIFESENGTIFIGTYGGGVSKFLARLETAGYKGSLFQTISTSQGLSNDRVLCMLQDREKNIWIGTFLNLNQYFDEQFEIFGENEGLTNSLVWSVIQDTKGNFWLGTEGGLIQFTPDENSDALLSLKQNGKISTDVQSRFHFRRVTGKEGQILNTSSLCEDKKGNIWFSDFGKGISRLDPATGTIRVFNTSNGLPVNDIYCIASDASGNLWIGTNKGGLLKFDLQTETFVRYTTKDGLGSDQIYSIFCDSQKRLWLACIGGGLSMYDPAAAGKGDKMFHTFTESDGYPGTITLCMTEDQSHNIWIGAMDRGLYKYDGKTFKNYSTENGLSSNSSFLLVCDKQNNLWIGSGLGIDKMNLKDETFKHYGKGDGFLGIEINPNSACRDKNGNIWFGTLIGLVKYNVLQGLSNRMEPITSIKPPRIYFQSVDIPSNHEFSWGQNHITFDFIGTSLTNPKRVKYRYELVGADKDWSHIVKENSVTYPDLQPGKYTFQVRSCNSDGVWNKEPVQFSFTINPPFWKTPAFYIGLVIVIFAGIFIFIRIREKKLVAKNLQLEQKVAERTVTISKQKEELERKNTVITDSIEYARNIQHSLLPSEEEMGKHFPEHFALNMPKDIVSGDYYRIQETNDRLLIAVADCTGHGVPGAFMSVMGHHLFKDAVSEAKTHAPADILEALNTHILDSLKQNSSDLTAKYGMDIALIAIDKKKGQLEFSGAHNSLIIVRGNECIQLKGDKRSVGSVSKPGQKEFTNQSFSFQKNDTLYMFSDGYTDQVGGPEGKKFFMQPFRDLLQSVSSLPMPQQEEKLRTTIINWKGNKVQTDDILVVGLRIGF